MKNILLPLLILISFVEAQGQNVHRFRYIFNDNMFNGNLFLKSDSIKDVVKRDKTYQIRTKSQQGENYLFTPYEVSTVDTVSAFTKENLPATSQRGIIKKRDGDTLFIKLWGIDSTYYFITKDNDWRQNNGYLRIELPFKARVFTPTSIPFRVRFNSGAQLETSFLNVGVSHFWLFGTTKIFKGETVSPRMNYWGLGPFIGFSQIELNGDNTDNKISEKKNIGSISYGVNFIRSINNFNFIVAAGLENAIGNDAGKWEYNSFKGGLKPWLGFGIGLKVLDLALKPIADD